MLLPSFILTFWSFHLLKCALPFPLSPCTDCTRLCKQEWTIYRSHPALQWVYFTHSLSPRSVQWFVWWILIFQTHFFFHKQSFFSIMSAWGSMCSVFSVRFGFAHKWKSHTKAPNTYWWMRIWITWIPLLVILMNIHTVIAKSAQNVSFWVN